MGFGKREGKGAAAHQHTLTQAWVYMATESASELKTDKSKPQAENITHRRSIQAPDLSPAQLCFSHSGAREETRVTKPAGTQDGVGFATRTSTPAATGNMIGPNPFSINTLRLMTNQNYGQQETRELHFTY